MRVSTGGGTITIFPPHPAALLIPRPTPAERDALLQRIAREGLQVPLVLCDGLLLDGLTRQDVLAELEANGTPVEPRYITYSGGDAYGYVRSVNIHRRQLSGTRLLCAAVEWWDLVDAGTVAKPATAGKTRDAIAAEFGIKSGRQLDAVRRIRREAPVLFEGMVSGGLSVHKAEVELGFTRPRKVPPVPQTRAAWVDWIGTVVGAALARYADADDDWDNARDTVRAMVEELR